MMDRTEKEKEKNLSDLGTFFDQNQDNLKKLDDEIEEVVVGAICHGTGLTEKKDEAELEKSPC